MAFAATGVLASFRARLGRFMLAVYQRPIGGSTSTVVTSEFTWRAERRGAEWKVPVEHRGAEWKL